MKNRSKAIALKKESLEQAPRILKLNVPRPGLEPGITAPKTGVLPLHHRGMPRGIGHNSVGKDKKDFLNLYAINAL